MKPKWAFTAEVLAIYGVFTRPTISIACAVFVAIVMATCLNINNDRAATAEISAAQPECSTSPAKNSPQRQVGLKIILNQKRFWNAEILIVGFGLISALVILPSVKAYSE